MARLSILCSIVIYVSLCCYSYGNNQITYPERIGNSQLSFNSTLHTFSISIILIITLFRYLFMLTIIGVEKNRQKQCGNNVNIHIFIRCSGTIFGEALHGKAGIIINREVVNNIRYTDDIVLFADNIQDLLKLIHKVNTSSSIFLIPMLFISFQI